MKVKELINKLQELNETEKEVYFDDEEWGVRPVDEVIVTDFSSDIKVVLKSYN